MANAFLIFTNRKNLDEQCVETQRLHKEMFNTSLPAYRTPQLSSTLTNLEIPISSSTPSAYNFGQNLGSVSASSSPRKQMDFTSTTHVITQAQYVNCKNVTIYYYFMAFDTHSIW